MTDDLLKYKIGITLINGIGSKLAQNLIAYVGSVEGIFKESKQNLAKIPGIGNVLSEQIKSSHVFERAEKEIEFIRKNNIQTYFFTDKNYPFRLKECYDAPMMLYYKGNKDLNSTRFIGIVGTRKITEYGKELTRKLIESLSQKLQGAVIISGLAYGVDFQAHKASVEKGLSTIGVLGHGLDRLYPATHQAIANKMQENGGLLTEFISGTNPDKPNFVKRNRIIAGMSDALVVVESGERGGALITAELSNDYNKDTFAFPGRVGDDYSAGCNKLIKTNKAALIESADDLLRYMSWDVDVNQPKESIQMSMFMDLSEEETEIISEIRKYQDGMNVNELTVILGKPFSKISSSLLEMEFKGLVKCLPGGMYKIVK